jgi:hypothetical protein
MSVKIDGSGIITGLDADGISAQPVFPGNVLQVVSTTKTDVFSTTSTSYVAVTGLSVSITPISANSKILILGNLTIGQTSDATSYFRVSGGNATNYVGDADGSRTRAIGGSTFTGDGSGFNPRAVAFSQSISYLDSPNTTNEITYQTEIVRGGGSTGTVYINRMGFELDTNVYVRGASTIIAVEIAG